jgi:hypothetical protein
VSHFTPICLKVSVMLNTGLQQRGDDLSVINTKVYLNSS